MLAGCVLGVDSWLLHLRYYGTDHSSHSDAQEELPVNLIIIMKSELDNSVLRTFVFENEANFKSQNLEVPLRTDLETIDINYIVNMWRHKNAIHEPMEFKIYDPEINRYVALDLRKLVSKGFLYSPVIMIKYKTLNPSVDDEDIESLPSSKMSAESKREKNRERTIQEVLEYVR